VVVVVVVGCIREMQQQQRFPIYSSLDSLLALSALVLAAGWWSSLFSWWMMVAKLKAKDVDECGCDPSQESKNARRSSPASLFTS
jgi:hypothetical protein